ncbi:differentially expressed in FDCP 8 homolog isoform X2 [Bradysia coprophila]|uniref:differentially expressed in FDCP 8 homolog isoform X2 n=1 Tax=Bradysia coprophila TaxID=38358 RepID=UPI00187D9B3E|nr:differentially expressed in FDCP 8 homolog isoform X2 [Bradysia coprophila]
MHSLRGSLSNIPSTFNNIIQNLPALARNNLDNTVSNSSTSSLSGEDSEKSQAIPNSLITEQWQLILGQNASVDDLESAISRCKELVLGTDECSFERKWLVRHLVELRFRRNELRDMLDDPNTKVNDSNVTKVILGHHFIRNLKHTPTSRQFCDHCSGIIWSVVQASYICQDCSFRVHHKCVQFVIRICAHVIASERNGTIEDICPEVGLAIQGYKCAECEVPLNFKNRWIEPRKCDYTGLYYCPTCHWNDTTIVPARIVHNWDFTPQKVCRASLQELNLIFERPIIDLEQRNAKLYIFVQNLSLIHKMRENLNEMRKYLNECRFAATDKLVESSVGTKRYLVQSTKLYSISDLASIDSGVIVDFLNKVYHTFDKHIRTCDICTGKGYLCEICSNNEVIYPYDDAAVRCVKCTVIFHRACWIRKSNKCPKCIRIEERKLKVVEEETDGVE